METMRAVLLLLLLALMGCSDKDRDPAVHIELADDQTFCTVAGCVMPEWALEGLLETARRTWPESTVTVHAPTAKSLLNLQVALAICRRAGFPAVTVSFAPAPVRPVPAAPGGRSPLEAGASQGR